MRNVKKIIAIFIIILTSAVVISYAKTGTVTTTVRIREANTTSSNIVTTAYVGDTITILDQDDTWYKVSYNNQTGFIMKKYITLSSDSTITNVVENATQNTVSNYTNSVENTVSAQNLALSYELRNAPSIIYKPVSKLDNLDNLQIQIDLGLWVKVSNGTISRMD